MRLNNFSPRKLCIFNFHSWKCQWCSRIKRDTRRCHYSPIFHKFTKWADVIRGTNFVFPVYNTVMTGHKLYPQNVQFLCCSCFLLFIFIDLAGSSFWYNHLAWASSRNMAYYTLYKEARCEFFNLFLSFNMLHWALCAASTINDYA